MTTETVHRLPSPSFARSSWTEFYPAARTVLKHVEVPAEWAELEERRHAYDQQSATVMTKRLVEAVLAGDPKADIPAARAAAIAERVKNDLDEEVVRPAIWDAMRQIYADHAREFYTVIAAKFDTAADAFTKIATAVNVELPAELAVELPAKDLTSWKEAVVLAAELEDLKTVLVHAGTLAGAERPNKSDVSSPRLTAWSKAQREVGLTVDATGAHVRKIWEAWDSQGRTGRWGAIVATGAKVRAADLDSYEPQRRAKPILERTLPNGTREAYDPEDTEQPVYVDGSGAWKPKAAPGAVTATVTEVRPVK